MRKKILLSAGGTGGHLFPAQVVAKQLSEKFDILFVGGRLSQNVFFDKGQFPFQEIPASTISKKPWKDIFPIVKGIKKSRQILKEFKPDLVIGFGSYYTFPLLVSSLMMKVPLMLHEQNAIPGRVTRLFSRFAKVTAISFPKTKTLLRGNMVNVSYPLRVRDKETDPWQYFGLKKGGPVLLVFGGSQGAKMLNHRFMETVPLLPKEMQILHFTGDKTISLEATTLYKSLGLSYCVKEFEKNMMQAFSIADCVISRAGASTCFELIEWEKPSLLIPFPFAKDNHQFFNASHFVDEVKGGQILLQEQITPILLKEMIIALFEAKEEKKKNIKEYKTKNRLKEFSDLITEYLEQSDE